jgi:catechol 2,3-dioxygenase-like lactoylglutathione lyase family enzyme
VIGGLSQAGIEVEDKQRAKRFWTETLGFEVAQDAPSRARSPRAPGRVVAGVSGSSATTPISPLATAREGPSSLGAAAAAPTHEGRPHQHPQGGNLP